ncbi:hypothetical protein Nepgr_018084 [Nepenthes gracilis]|uniref:NAD(P)-binding domain-containing protein n=1 Tax=Nepenthes gracilis TaxID=150966 RepID=A0AAD3XT53_NEPGR|nr:hypothetical protein Nepgr_018084 [Nepenthes gracilis]
MALPTLVRLPSNGSSIPISVTRPFVETKYIHRRILKFDTLRTYPCSMRLKLFDIRARQAARTARFSSTAIPEVVSSENEDRLVFVAGATGRVGSRTVRELLKLGFRVRAGVRNVQRAKTLLQSAKQMEIDTETNPEEIQPVERLEIVECDLEKREEIGPALGNASLVICCIGASEKEIFDITGPYRIDYQATKNLIEAATSAKVDHFILLSSLGTNKIGFPAAILNLFWGVLIWKRKSEEALIASGLPYTIVRPGGMERPTDSYKDTHNITLSQEDTLFGGQVSNLQVAELMAFMAKNENLSYCKVVEVIAETTSPLRPMGELLAKIPSQHSWIHSSAELDAASKPDPASAKNSIFEASRTPSEKEPIQDNPVPTRPLSPYTVYKDLKPPSSPSPTPPGEPREVTFSSSRTVVLPPSFGGNGAPDITDSAAMGSGSLVSRYSHSPYPVYVDFKPPTTPSPNAPKSSSAPTTSPDAISQMAEVSDNNAAEKAGDTERSAHLKPSPLSPYTMYNDMKPPSTPMPSPGNRQMFC